MATDPKQQRENIRLQNEYNEALKMSQSISGALIKDLDEQIDKRTTLGKKVQDYIKDLQSSISQLETSDDVQKKLVDNEGEIAKIQKSHFGANKKVGDEKIKALKLTNDSLRIEGDRLQLIEMVDAEAQNLAQSLGSSLDGLIGGLDDIPLIGGALSRVGNIGASAIKDQLGNAAMKFTTTFASGLRSGMGAMQALGAAGSAAGSVLTAALASPLVIIGLIAAGIAIAVKRFSELDAAAQDFRDNTGLLVSQTRGMQENIRAVNVEFANLGVSAQDVAKAASEFVNEFDGLEQPSQAVLGSMVTLNKNFGVGTQEAAKLNKVFQNIGNLSAEQSQYLIGQTAEMAKMAGVAPQKVIKDMADSSEYAYKYFKGSPQELAKAAVQAAKMGTSIAEAGKAADNLLDFQNSISSELEASAILGVNLNLSQARYAAANGDLIGQQQAINDQVAKLGDLTKLNVFEQDALAKATGMEFSSLVNQQRIRERFGKLNEEQLAAATSLLDTGKDINDINQKDLELQSQKLKSQQDMQSTMSALQNEAGGLKTGFMDMLAPLAGFAMNVLLDGLKMLGMILNPIMKGIGAIARVIFGVFGMVMDLVSAILMPIVAIGGAIIDMLVTPFQALASKMQPLSDRFKELKETTMKAVQPILDIFRSLGQFLGEMVSSGPVGMFIDFLTWGLGKVVSLIGFIAKGIAFVLKPIMTLIGYLMEGISFIGKMINDYIIQPALAAGQMVGNVLSTLTFGLVGGDDSEGTSTGGTQGGTSQVQDIPLMAEGGIVQSPIQAVVGEAGPEAIIPLDQLASVLGGVSAPTNERPSWVDEVVAAFRENKDVYMDRIKVSSTITDTQERSGRQNRFGLQGA